MGEYDLSGNGFDEEAVDEGIVGWQWARTAKLAEHRELPRLRPLPERQRDAIIIGGGSELLSTSSDTTEVFSLEAREWSPGPPLNHPHRDAEVVEQRDGSLLVIGGSEGPTKTGSVNVERLERGERKFDDVAPLGEPRIGHAAVVLDDGRVLVTGGQADPDTFLQTGELYDPDADSWDRVEPMSEARATHHLRRLPDGRAIAIGGGTDITATHTVEIYDPREGAWSPTASMEHPRWGFASAMLDDGSWMVAGGRVPAQKGATLPDDQMIILRATERYDPATERWSGMAPLNVPRTMGIPNVELLQLPSGGLLFPGGRTYPFPYHGTASAEYFDLDRNAWRMVAPMRTGASYHAFLLINGGDVLTAGGRGARFRPLQRSEYFSAVEA